MAPPAEFNEKGVVWALVCGIGDVCADVRVAAQTSLCILGAQQPQPVLRALLHTCMQQPSPSPGVLATLMDISQKVMIDFSRGGGRCIRKGESEDATSDNVFDDGPNDGERIGAVTSSGAGARPTLDSQILDDWLAEAVHQLTRAAASNTVRVAADNLLVTIASKHCYFKQVVVALLAVLSNSSAKEVSWQSAAESLGNVCSCEPRQALSSLPALLQAMLDGAEKASTDQVRSVVAATVAKLAHTVAEAVAENDNKSNNNMTSDGGDRYRGSEAIQERGGGKLELRPPHECSSEQKGDEDAGKGRPVEEDEAISEPLSEPINTDIMEPALNSDMEREPLEGSLLGELNLEQELNQVQLSDSGEKRPDNLLLSARLPDSPPSSRQEAKRPEDDHSTAVSDSTPEDGLTLDLNLDDLPHDPQTVSETSNSNVCLSSYTGQCDLLADVLVSQWLKTNNSELRNETIAAIGHICALLSQDKLEAVTPTVITTVIGLYRKISLPYNLTCTLAQILSAVVKQEAYECFKPQLESLMGAVLSQASVVPCYTEPNSVSNHSEALRCCHLLTLCYPAQMGAQLLSRLENASHVQRVAALVVTKHLIGCKVLSSDVIAGTVRLLNPILHDSNTRVIRAVAQLILELCHNGHLDETSAPPLIAYLVKHGAGAGNNLLCNGTSNGGSGGSGGGSTSCMGLMAEETVGDTCSRALYLLTTTVPCAHPLLWPRLLTFLVNPDFESSLSTVLPCLAHLVTRPHHAPDVQPLLPMLPLLAKCITPQQLVTRLLGLCADPASHPSLGGCALSVLGGLGGHLSPHLQGREWREQVEQLRRTCVSLAATEQDLTALQIWQDTVREFLGLTLTAIADQSFTNGLVSAMLSEASTESEGDRRVFLISALGVALRHSCDARLITDILNSVLRLTNHRSPLEQAGLGVCVGSCGAGHTQLVLGLLAAWLKEADTKKMLSFMAMLKSDSGEGSACLRGSVVVCLGQLCSLAPHEQLAQHVDGPIMLHLLNVINSNKHPSVAAAVVECISCVCRALTAVPGGFELRQRPLLIAHLVHSCDATTPAQLPPMLAALRDLVLLEPVLEVEERTILLQAALNATHSLLTGGGNDGSDSGTSGAVATSNTNAGAASSSSTSRGSWSHSSLSHRLSLSHTASNTLRSLTSAGSALSTPRHSITSFSAASLSSLPSMTSRAPSALDDKVDNTSAVCGPSVPVEADALSGDGGRAFAQLNLLLRTIIQRDPTPAPLDDITTLLQAWLLHASITVRSAAITLLLHTLHTFHTHLQFPPQVAVNFHQTSQLVGAVVPRLGDSCGGVRCGGVGCVVAVLRVAARYNAHQPQQIEEALHPLTDVQKEIGSSSGEHHEALLRKVAQVLCRELSGVQLRGLVFAAAGGLQDKQSGGRHAVAVVVAEILKQRGHTLHYCCKQLLDHVYGRLERVNDLHTRAIVVDGLTHLASPHLPLLADTLLSYPIPPHRGVCETWHAIGCNPALVCAALTHLQQVVERTHAYTPQRTPTGHTVKVAAIQPLAALLCLTQLLHKLQNPSSVDTTTASTALKQQQSQQAALDVEGGITNNTDLTGSGGTTPSSSSLPPSLATTATLGGGDEGGQRSGCSTPTPAPHPYTEAREAVIGAVPGLLAALLPRYGSYVGVLPPLHHTPSTPSGADTSSSSSTTSSAAPTHKAMSSFVPNPGATTIVPARALIECLANVWGVLGCSSLRDCLLQEARDLTHTHTLDTLTHTLTSTATLVVSSAPQQLSALVAALSGPHAERGERAAIAAFYSQLVHESCGGQYEVLSRVTSVLLMLVQDVCPDVRRLSLRGLAHYAHLHHNKVDDRLHEIVGALVGGTDQRENTMTSIDADTDTPSPSHHPHSTSSPSPHISSGSRSAHGGAVGAPLGPEERVCVEALRGLAALLPQLPPETVLPHTPLLLIRARLFAEKSNGEMREASFGVVRGLSAVVGDTHELQEHLPQHLLAALIHLADAHQPTVVLCKSALLSLSQHVSCPDLRQLMQARLSPSASLDYKTFLASLAPLLVTWLGDQLSLAIAATSSYYHSRQPELRAAAAHFTGEVVRWGGGEGASGVAIGLVHLMKDTEPAVRTAAATASHLLSQHAHVL